LAPDTVGFDVAIDCECIFFGNLSRCENEVHGHSVY